MGRFFPRKCSARVCDVGLVRPPFQRRWGARVLGAVKCP